MQFTSTSEQQLTWREADEILRYWLLALRYEESLSSRPHVRKVDPARTDKVNTLEPSREQNYFKLMRDAAPFLLRDENLLELPLNPERAAFAEHCIVESWWHDLAMAKHRERKTELQAPLWVVGFPVVHFQKRGELAGLLRFNVDLSWLENGSPWTYPTLQDQRKRVRQPSPTSLKLSFEKSDDDDLPFSLDAQLLTRDLAICDEDLSDFYEVLRSAETLKPRQVVSTLCALLNNTFEGKIVNEKGTSDELFLKLYQAVEHRLLGSEHCYPVAICYDDSRIAATVHVQNELSMLLQRVQHPPIYPRALASYLLGAPVPKRRRTFHGRYCAKPLNPEQLSIGENFLGGELWAAQGPPGTGKTQLCLNLAAAEMVNWAREVAETGSAPTQGLVIASTNNRAVDNVLEPFAALGGVWPCGLRLGNREFTSGLAVEVLNNFAYELSRVQCEDPMADFDHACDLFNRQLQEIIEENGDLETALEREQSRSKLRLQLEKLGDTASVSSEEMHFLEEAQLQMRSVRMQLGRLDLVLNGTTSKTIAQAERRWNRAEGVFKKAARDLANLGLDFPHSMPPDVPRHAELEDALDAWQTAVSDSLDVTRERMAEIENRLHDVTEGVQRAKIEAELAELLPSEAADKAVLKKRTADLAFEAEHRLFLLALDVRQAWIALHKSSISQALQAAVQSLSTKCSFRRFIEDDEKQSDWILKLFPVLGTTLLSLGNTLPPSSDSAARMILDEAGQCHPAYAISALMRAEQVLCIGDVHQLEPVVRLSLQDEERVQRQAKLTISPEKLEPYRVHEKNTSSAQRLADRAVLCKHERPTLRAHYRCQPGIISISNALCEYGLRVETKPKSWISKVNWLTNDVLLFPTQGEQRRQDGSWANDAEVHQVVSLCNRLFAAGIGFGEIAIITPYVGQYAAILQALRRAQIPTGESFEEALESQQGLFAPQGEVAIGTVHRFQGGERSIVIFSTVCTTLRSLSFLNERVNLVNVAVSRAREHLLVVGNPEILARGPCTLKLIETARAVPEILTAGWR